MRIINPFAPGGATDIIARQMAQKLTELWGQAVVVENRAGASGAIGVEMVAKSPPDGYTLLIATQTTHAANPALYPKLPYDAAKDFAPLTLAGSTPLALLVRPSLPVTSVKELIDFARKNPAKLVYASGGNGTSQHLTTELMKSMSGTFMLHIPYRGAGPAMTDLLGGQVDLHVRQPAYRAAAYQGRQAARARRDDGDALVARTGSADDGGERACPASSWQRGLRSSRPQRHRSRSSTRSPATCGACWRNPTCSSAWPRSASTLASSPEELATFQRAELTKWGKIIKDSGATVD